MLWGLAFNSVAQTANTAKSPSDAAWDAYADAKVLGTPSGAVQTYEAPGVPTAAGAPKKPFPTALVVAGVAAAIAIVIMLRSKK